MTIRWPSFIDRIPSPVVECASGLLCAAFGRLWTDQSAYVLLIATTLSLVYEFVFDANVANRWADIGQRSLGILAGVMFL